MITRKEVLSRSALAALLAATMGVSAPTQAADATAADTGELTEVVITGSLLRRTDAETPSPVSVLTAEDLGNRGINTVAEAMQRLSVNGSGTITQGWNAQGNFATGANAVSLRGLTVQATLSVFDGLRMAPYPLADDGHRNFVDLNTIPDAVVDRIEVLKDGASSTYGADAIAGVVNVITKKEIQGLHFNASGGSAERGGGTERRLDATWGMGELANQGYNFYVTGEYQDQGIIHARDLNYPFGSGDLSHVCDASGNCLGIQSGGLQFGTNANGSLSAGTTTNAPLVAPVSATNARTAPYRLLNTAAGCNVEPGLTPVTLTAAQAGTTFATSQCSQDLNAQFAEAQPYEQRYGGMAKFTAKVFGNSEFYATGTYYDVNSVLTLYPLTMTSATTAPRQVSFSGLILPVYVCAAGVGVVPTGATGFNSSTGCNATNGTFNPNNPFATAANVATGTATNAIVRWRYDRPRVTMSDAKSFRGATGLNGTFGSDWTYSADVTFSKVKLEILNDNYLIPQRLANVAATGAFNFVNPTANSEAIRNYIAPRNINDSDSKLSEAQASIGKTLLTMPGGPLQAVLGASYRKESITNPSANPDNIAAPYTRFQNINAVGATGERNVKSGFFEVGGNIIKQFEADLSGRYDDYSSGQTNFSPKLGLKYKPIDQLVLRGTYSKGFRIPSFNESFGLPTTGFSNGQVQCAIYTAFCAAHNNNTYATATYSPGTTATGNPALNPEKSTSYTLGLVFEPYQGLAFTVDYWNIEVKDLISQVSATDRATATDAYYRNNGVVNIPGITVTPGTPDVAFPNALPLLGTINYSYTNADKENVSGVDFGVNATFPLSAGVKLLSSVDASLLGKYTLTRKNGDVERYDGTLSPCDYTSCSGSPKWRGSWSNTLQLEKLSLTGTVYYTSGYNLAEVDYGGDPNDCSANDGSDGAPTYLGTSIPSACSAKAQWNIDLGGRYKVNDHLLVYLDVQDAFNIGPVFDPAATYSLTQYNVAWGQANAVGRFFRLGVKLDL